MITIFSTPKNFENIFDIIQKNALNSWRALSSEVEIIIFGDAIGSEKNAHLINAVYMPEVRVSKSGVPYLSDLFAKAQQYSTYDTLVFINADIILPNNFIKIVSNVKNQFRKYLMVGHRWDMDVNTIIDFYDQDKAGEFWQKANEESIKHPSCGIDYFVFNRNTFKALPDFAIGRPGYDNWLLWNARRHFIPLVDTSRDIKVIHQNHHFNFHNLKADPKIYFEEDGKKNKMIHGERTLNLLDTNYYIKDGKVYKNKSKDFINRNLGKLPIIFPEFGLFLIWYKKFYRRLMYMLGKWKVTYNSN